MSRAGDLQWGRRPPARDEAMWGYLPLAGVGVSPTCGGRSGAHE